jgi:hypothetical protein
MSFSIESKLGDLLDSAHPQIAMGRGFALSMVAKFSGGLITEEMLQKVNAELSGL